MKRYIYTTLLVFATLFCQASGVQNEPPTILDTTICVRKGDTIKVYEYQEQILQLLENREKEIWGSCCDRVSVELKGVPIIDPSEKGIHQIKNIEGWPAITIDGNSTFSLDVSYIRHLRCSDILKCKEDTASASLAMWHFFGKLVSESETGAVTKISDTAFVSTLHKVKLKYQIGMSFPDVDFKIQGDSCFEDPLKITLLNVPDSYSSCRLKWLKPKDLEFAFKTTDTSNEVILSSKSDNYLFPVICIAISCTGDTVSDTIRIGKPTPVPEIDDLGCIAANDTSFNVEVNNSDSQLSYYWIVEDWESGDSIDVQQGASVTMSIPQNKSVRLKLRSSGGCKDAEMEPVILHRSLVPEAHHIEMEPEPHCIFEGDTLRFFLPEMPEDTLVWQVADNDKVMLPAHDICNYQALRVKENVPVSVYAKSCPDNIITDTFNIRKDLAVSIEPNESCIRAYTAQTFKAIGNGIHPEIFWNRNGVEIDTVIYGKKDSVQLRLTNPGGDNLFVAVMAKECGRESEWDTLVLRPKPEIPKLDTLWKALTPCIPLGMADTIELRVQPQEGVKFRWSILEEEITEFDSNSIPVRVNYKLSDKDAPIPVSVYAYTDGCPNSDTLSEILKATGAGLGPEWHIDSKAPSTLRRTVGFCQYSPDEIQNSRVELDTFAFLWTSSVKFQGSNSLQALQFVRTPLPIDVTCLLTNKRTSCYSYYAQTIAEATTLQNILTLSNDRDQFGSINETSEMTYMDAHSSDNSFDGIVLTPNPTQGNTLLYLGNTDIRERTVVEIFTEQGVCLYRQKAKGSMVELPTARFGSGLYFVRVRTAEGNRVVKKLIVQ